MDCAPVTLQERLASDDQSLPIDRLLHAAARQDEQLQREAGKQAGEIAVALDTITRWIGNAEHRFAAITALERKLDHIEHRLKAGKPERLTRQLTALSWQLDLQSRLATRNTHSSIRYFELMTSQIESFAGELRQLRKKSDETRKKTEFLPELVEKIDLLAQKQLDAIREKPAEPPEHPAITAMSKRLDEAVSRLDSEREMMRIARESAQADMDILRQRIRKLEELGRFLSASNDAPAQPAAHSDSVPQNPHIRSSFIAAARQAMRGDQDGKGLEHPGNRFLRTATDDI